MVNSISNDGASRTRQYGPPPSAQPSTINTNTNPSNTNPSETRSSTHAPPEMDHPIEYPAEMFAGTTNQKPNAKPANAPNHQAAQARTDRPNEQATQSNGTAAAQAKTVSRPPGHYYTKNANEISVNRTTPTTQDLAEALGNVYGQDGKPVLTEQGVHVLMAQVRGETGNGRYCFNYNLGNMKAGTDVPHHYLTGTRERYSPEIADNWVKRSNAHIATNEEIQKNKWPNPSDGKKLVVFDPPHPVTRFRAYGSLKEGAIALVDYYAKRPEILKAINSGDPQETAHLLKNAGYYTENETVYTNAMTKNKAQVDKDMANLRAKKLADNEKAIAEQEAREKALNLQIYGQSQ